MVKGSKFVNYKEGTVGPSTVPKSHSVMTNLLSPYLFLSLKIHYPFCR